MNAEQASKFMMQVPTSPPDLGKADEGEEYERSSFLQPAGVVATACKQRGLKATREAPAVIAVGSTGSSRETGRAVWGGGEACSTDEAG